MKKIFLLVLAASTFYGSLNAQAVLTGSLKEDARIAFEETKNIPFYFNLPATEKKSPILAGLMSLVVPGAGEIYSGEYIKAGIFLAIEAAVITTAVIYDKKGDDKTSEFEAYADDRWSVVRYAQWLNDYKQKNIPINPNEALKPWERVDWAILNESEEGSHRLPPHGEQQYYEMIGKYFQYSAGWDDYTAGANNHEISPNYKFYSGMRGQANDYYNVASKAVIGIYINHFLSALDAVWSAVSFNKDLSLNIRTENIQYADRIEIVPTLNMRFAF